MDQKSLDLLSIGDASIDVFISPTESETLCMLDDKESKVCFSYGDKIPVKRLEFSIGGNAANNAIGVRRLGVNVGIVLTLGDDNVGGQITEKLDKEGVDTTYVIQQPSTVSNYSTIVNYSGERTIFSYHAPRSYEFPVQLPKTPWVYLTSMGETFMPFYNHVADWIEKNPDTKLAFNPGSRQMRAGVKSIQKILEFTHMIFVNRKEAEKLTGMKETQGKEKELLIRFSKIGPKVVVVTDGANGSFIYDSGEYVGGTGQKFVRAEVFPVDSHERTGAGDAFGSGCLAAIIRGKSLEEALLWGTLNSASVIGYVGSQKGLLKEDQMEVWLDRAKSSEVKTGTF